MLQHTLLPMTNRADIPSQFESQASRANAEWENMFSAPLDPSTFHRLAAQGFIAPPTAGVPSSLPSASNHTPHDFGVNTRTQPLNVKDLGRRGLPMAWSNVSSPYASPPATSQGLSPINLRSGSGGSASFVRRKSPVAGPSQPYGPVNLRHPSSSMPLPISPFEAQAEFIHDRQSALSPQMAGGLPGDPSVRGSILALGLDTHLNGFTPTFPSHRSPYEFHPHPTHHTERVPVGLPPSMWMSPTTAPSSSSSYSDASLFSLNQIPHHPRHSSISDSLVTSSSPTALSLRDSGKSTAPTSFSSPKGRVLSDLFSDPLFSLKQAAMENPGPQPFASPKVSGSPDLQSVDLAAADADPEKLAKEDPLATQVWKMYARQKATLPHAQRMENLTWRMMALALKKKKEDEGREREKERAKELEKEKEKDREADAQTGGGPGPTQPGGEKAAEGTGPSTGGAETAQETERGRTIDKGKARVQVVGFDGENQDGADENECVCVFHCAIFRLTELCFPFISEVPMDWRAISRSRSRAPMDWRPASRSRSRPPMVGMADLQNQFKFPSSSPPKRDVTSPSIPIPGSAGRRSPHPSLPSQFMLPAVFESTSEHRGHYGNVDSSALFHSPLGHPSSLPSTGILTRTSTSTLPSPEVKAFPKHVRKTSFDHTVAKEGIFTGVSGRHQVNGKPRSPESLVGTKRRADAPHAESMLRADPPAGFDLPPPMDAKDLDPYRRSSPFPSSSFSFSLPTHYDSFFDLVAANGGIGGPNVSSSIPTPKEHPASDLPFADSIRTSLNGTYSPSIGVGNEGMSAAAAVASAAITDSYAQFSMGNLDMENYQLMNMMYNSTAQHDLSSTLSSNHGSFTVDPNQILPLEPTEAIFHRSPSSDGWGNGVGSSSGASPEPYTVSTASTPPSAEGAAGSSRTAQAPRKIASSKRVDNATRAGAGGAQRKGCVFVVCCSGVTI